MQNNCRFIYGVMSKVIFMNTELTAAGFLFLWVQVDIPTRFQNLRGHLQDCMAKPAAQAAEISLEKRNFYSYHMSIPTSNGPKWKD